MDKDLEIENLRKALERQKKSRKQAELFMESKSLELYKSNQKLKEIISNTNKFPEENPNPVLRFSAKGHVLMYSNKAGKSIIEYLDKKGNHEVRLFFTRQVEISFRKETIYQFELEVGNVTYLFNAVPFKLNNYINVYANDITAIKQANESIKLSEEKYRGIIENLKLGILEADNDDKIIKAYPKFCLLSGYKESELIGKSPTEIFLDETSRKIMNEQNEKRKEGKSGAYEVPLIKKNGEVAWVIISGAPFYDCDGNTIGTVGIHLDISERKLMESELREAKLKAEQLNKVKEMFLANMSHEIRTPLNAIIGMSELLEQSKLDRKQIKYLSAVQSSSKNLLVLINDLLDVSKIDSGKLSLELVDFNLTKLVSKTIQMVSIKAEENGVKLLSLIEGGIPDFIKGDPTRLGQVLLNLMSNAVKFTTNGSVTISLSLASVKNDHYEIKFSVIDEGLGIPKKELSNIFKDFSQAQDSTTRLYGGTGLGLSISQKIVHLMGGEIKVLSELNRGSEFTFSIFMKEPKTVLDEDEIDKKVILVTNFKRGKILVVEDNPVNSLMATTILENWNCQVFTAENGLDAIDMLSQFTYDVVLMDMRMPKMGGLEATKIIRGKLKILTPIIALTANAIKGDVKKCLDAGMNDYLSKPYHQNELNEILVKWLDVRCLKEERLYSLSKLEEIGDQNFLDKMINLFIDETEITIQLIEDSLQNLDYEKVSSLAHKVKPSMNFVCIPRMYNVALQIEDWNGEVSVLVNKTEQFIVDLKLLIKQLKELR